MAWRPTSFVVEGELDNTTQGWTLGWIRLDGRDEPLRLKLAGNCHPDLAGWKFRIVRTAPDPDRESEMDSDHPIDFRKMATDQSGIIGDVTADQMLRHFDCSTTEFLGQVQLGCPPPTVMSKSLYLEWFSNLNGRVVIQSTRLAVERIGKRAFELSEEQYQEQAQKNHEEMEFFMERLVDALNRKVDSGELPENNDE